MAQTQFSVITRSTSRNPQRKSSRTARASLSQNRGEGRFVSDCGRRSRYARLHRCGEAARRRPTLRDLAIADRSRVMSIERTQLLRNCVGAIHERDAALFIGAGLSRPAGFVDCRRGKGRSGSENGRYANRNTVLMVPIVLASVTVSSRRETILVATANPVAAGSGGQTTEIRWSTGDGSVGELFVSIDNGREILFARNPEGVQAANWVRAGSVYVFRLYRKDSTRRLLASIEIRQASAGERTQGS
jgi:hypothetical protein